MNSNSGIEDKMYTIQKARSRSWSLLIQFLSAFQRFYKIIIFFTYDHNGGMEGISTNSRRLNGDRAKTACNFIAETNLGHCWKAQVNWYRQNENAK